MAERQQGVGRWRGLNTVEDPSVLEPGELVRGRNLVSRSGALTKRPGLLRLTTEGTVRAWPPYVPPVELPWVVQGDLWFVIEGPASGTVVVGDHWTLRLRATNRSLATATGFAAPGGLTLTVEGLNGSEAWVGFAELDLADGTDAGDPPTVTEGWSAGVWERLVTVADAAACSAIRLTLAYDGKTYAVEVFALALLAEIEVQLPAEGVTPGVEFGLLLVARDALGAVLPDFSGRTVSLAWDDGAATPVTVNDVAGTGFDERGWVDGIGEWSAVMPARGAADLLRVKALIGAVEEGTDETDIVEPFVLSFPTHAQAFQERTLRMEARGARNGLRTGFDGTGYSLAVEGYDAAGDVWEAWAGLVTFPGGTAPDAAAGWSGGVWSQVLRFTDAGVYSAVRLTLLRGAVEAATPVEAELHPVTRATVTMQGAVQATAGFAVQIVVQDEQGVAVMGFDGTSFALDAVDEDGTAVALTAEDSETAPAVTAGWSRGIWFGRIEFADAGGAETLTVRAKFAGTAIGWSTATIGAGLPGEVYGFAILLPTAIQDNVPFAIHLTALDFYQHLVEDYTGAELALRWTMVFEDGEEEVLVPDFGNKLAEIDTGTGWVDGVWGGPGSERYYTSRTSWARAQEIRLETLLGGEVRGSQTTTARLEYTLAVPSSVTAGNTYSVLITAADADGNPAEAYVGEGLQMRMYRNGVEQTVTRQPGNRVFGAFGPNLQVGWANGRWIGTVAAGSAGTVVYVLEYVEKQVATATLTVVESIVPPGLPEEPEEPEEPDEEEEEPEVVQLELSGPGVVYPGCGFGLGVRADRPSYEGEGATLAVTPGATPAPVIGSGWSGGEWSWTGRLSGGVAGGEMVATLAWDPVAWWYAQHPQSTATGGAPEGATQEDYTETLTARIGQLTAKVDMMPARIWIGRQFGLWVAMDSEGGGRLADYDGTLFEGFVAEVSLDGSTWVDAAGMLTAAGGGALPTTGWSDGRIKPSAVLNAGANGYTKLRVAVVADGLQSAWKVATVVEVGMDVDVTGTESLHAYGAAGTITATVHNADGSDATDANERLTLVVQGMRGGTWSEFADLVDEGTGLPVSLASGWTGNVWSVQGLLALASGATQARLLFYEGTKQRAQKTIALREDVAVAIGAPAGVVEDRDFSLTLTATDAEGGALPRFDSVAALFALAVTHGSVDTPAADLIDAGTGLDPDFTAGWAAGLWTTAAARISEPCTAYTVTVRALGSGETLATASIAVEAVESAVVSAIYERQLAWGITTPWDAGAPTNTSKLIDITGNTAYTMAQLRAYVNKLTATAGTPALQFVAPADNSWSGGSAAPTLLASATWATAENAATEAALYALVVSLRRTGSTSGSLWYSQVAQKSGYGQDQVTTPSTPNWQTAYDAAVAAVADDPMAFGGAYMQNLAYRSGTTRRVSVNIEWQTWRTDPAGLTTELGKTVLAFTQFNALAPYGAYAALTITYAGDENQYVEEDSMALGAAAGGTGATKGAVGGAPARGSVPEPSMPGADGTAEEERNALPNARVVLVDWEFAYT